MIGSIPHALDLALFCLLLHAIVEGLGNHHEVVLIPEKVRVASVRPYVVHHRTIRRWVLADEEDSGPLASIEVTGEYTPTQALPFRRLVPGTPWRCCASLLVALLTIAPLAYEAGTHRAKAGPDTLQLGHGESQ